MFRDSLIAVCTVIDAFQISEILSNRNDLLLSRRNFDCVESLSDLCKKSENIVLNINFQKLIFSRVF